MHTFRITKNGLQIFPRSFGLTEKKERPRVQRRISTGVTGLDALLGGGIPVGDSTLVAGPTGSGKSALCTKFIAEGIKHGEPGDYVARAEALGLKIIYGDRLSLRRRAGARTEFSGRLPFSPHDISFLTDNIILQRYIELDGRLQKVVTVVKTRRGNHSKTIQTDHRHRATVQCVESVLSE